MSGKSDSDPSLAPLYVTQPELPPLEELLPALESIWDSRQLTNGGPFHQEFEVALAEYLGVEHLSLFCNGTIALITALQALRITGEVITTPYSFPATSHALLWNGIEPVFVDVDPATLNLDPAQIEAVITPRTTGIMPMHCYGQPCDVDAIQTLARDYNLRVVYDAAHAFGVRRGDGSLLSCGDLSVLSFHATKVFQTFEGGAIVSPDAATKLRVDRLKNFGFVDEETVVAPGINGKMSEFNAALGMLQLKHAADAAERRSRAAAYYAERIAPIPGIRVVESPNASYAPIMVEEAYPLDRDGLFEKFRSADIVVRKYFSPLLTHFPMYRGFPSASPDKLPHAEEASRRVLCLPMFARISREAQDRVLRVLESA